jgi:hypothetical protein
LNNAGQNGGNLHQDGHWAVKVLQNALPQRGLLLHDFVEAPFQSKFGNLLVVQTLVEIKLW